MKQFLKPIVPVSSAGIPTSNKIVEYDPKSHPAGKFKHVEITRQINPLAETFVYWRILTGDSGKVTATPITKPLSLNERKTRFSEHHKVILTQIERSMRRQFALKYTQFPELVELMKTAKMKDLSAMINSNLTLRLYPKTAGNFSSWVFGIDVVELTKTLTVIDAYLAAVNVASLNFITDRTGTFNFQAAVIEVVREAGLDI